MRRFCAFIIFAAGLASALPTSVEVEPQSQIPSNSIGDITYDGEYVWISTGNGLARTRDGGTTWEYFLDGYSFSVLTYAYGRIFAASSKDTLWGTDYYPMGTGLWIADAHADSVVFQHLRPWQMTFKNDTSFFGMLSYDICVVPTVGDTYIYSASWYGGLARSADWGLSWENVSWIYSFHDEFGNVISDSGTVVWEVIPENQDSLADFVENEGYDDLFFAVAVDTSESTPVVYSGTASGIFAIRGDRFYRSLPEDGLTGSWTVALAVQYPDSGGSVIWASSRSTGEGGEADGICYSADGGRTWDTLATGLICWNFAFCGDTVFFLCEQGFYRFAGDTLEQITITDRQQNLTLPLDQMISATVAGDTVWVGSDFGLAYSLDGCACEDFHILIHRESTEAQKTYAFPSPFSPHQHGTIFFVFDNPAAGEVKLEIFDFALDKLFETTQNFPKGEELMFQWDGRSADGEYPANGIYLYRITLPDGAELWGKFAFMQ